MKVLKRSLLALCAVIVILIAERTIGIFTSAPQIDGTLSMQGIGQQVEIIRDPYGVPHIYGESDQDVFFGLGVAHAQDRLWQMEFSRHLAKGRLSEILGASTIPFDRFFRSLTLDEAVESSFQKLSPNTKSLLRAYAAGVNAVIEHPKTDLPPEFTLLYHTPEPWTVYDSLLIPKLMSLTLSTNMFHELRRAQLLQQLGPEKLDAFLPDAPVKTVDLPAELVSIYENLAIDETTTALFDHWQVGASNNWVVDGRHTQSGLPLLANDPHLELSSPSVWYLAHMSLQSGDVIGATIAGLPSVILGRNNRIAWGFTNTGADVQDLYIEKINPDNRDEYLSPDGYRRFDIREDIIRVRFGSDVPITLRKTRNGPVLPADWQQSKEFLGDDHVLSLSWTALRDDDTTADASIAVMQAQSWDSFVSATKTMTHPMQNIVYGDIDGNIGFVAPAQVPIRKAENKLYGMFPALGWDETYDWDGFIPFDELPKTFNPPTGKIFTANNDITPPDYPYWITHLWEHEHRLNRISDLLNGTAKHSPESFITMQGDTLSPDTLTLKPYLLAISPSSDIEVQALRMIERWDGHMRKEQAAPLIYKAWLRELARKIYADELGAQFTRHWALKIDFIAEAMAGKPGMAAWCDQILTEAIEDCAGLAQSAFSQSIDDLTEEYGNNPETWSWGEAHIAVHAHRPFEQFPFLNSFFSRRVPSDGGFYTLNRGGHILSSQEPFANIHASGFRAIYDFADLDNSLFVQSTGQSGNPVSPFFETFLSKWAETDFIPMTTDRQQLQAAAVGRLVLTPSD